MTTKRTKTQEHSSKSTEREAFVTTSSKAAHEHFRAIAGAVPTAGLEVCRADVAIARINIERGVDAIRPHVATIRRKLPECPIAEVLELPALSLAILFEVDKILKPASSGEIERRLADIRTMREAGIKQLEVFGLLEIIPAEVASKIRAGSGPLDKARDAVAIPGAFHDYAAKVQGMHPFTPAMLAKLAADGDWLLAQLKPTGAKAGPSERDSASILRDQFWALITLRHEHLRQAGAVVFGMKQLDEHVPTLGARIAATSGGASPPAAGDQAGTGSNQEPAAGAGATATPPPDPKASK